MNNTVILANTVYFLIAIIVSLVIALRTYQDIHSKTRTSKFAFASASFLVIIWLSVVAVGLTSCVGWILTIWLGNIGYLLSAFICGLIAYFFSKYYIYK